MSVLKAIAISKEWNGAELFGPVSFHVNEGERVALIGRNGVGKTTLLRMLLGRTLCERGTIVRELPLQKWGALEQRVESASGLTAIEYAQSVSPERFELKRRIERLQQALERPGDGREAALTRYGEAYESYVRQDGYGWETEVEKSLTRLGLDPSVWGLLFDRLSGGQKTKAQLAGLMVSAPRFVLLDEPTNHLDAAAIAMLEDWVRGYAGTVLYVSHDRTFIDRTATAVLELERGCCRRFAGGYSAYRERKEAERRAQTALYRKQEHERQKLEESIRRYAQWFHDAHRAAGQNDFWRSKAKKNVSRLHAKEAALERLDRERTAQPRDTAQLRMKLTGEPLAASVLLRMEQTGFGYFPDRPLFEKLDLVIRRQDRLAVLGPNGAGKSTLLAVMTGRLVPSAGTVRLHPQAKIGYFAQELNDLDEEETLLDSLLKLPGMTQTEARTLLGCFLFSRDDAFKKIGDLSMGEKCRAAFLRLYFGRANLLVLDEPTNFLDIDARERVENALAAYPGAIVVVSHDRYLVQAVAERLVVLNGRSAPVVYDGTLEEYAASERRGGGEEQLAAREREDERDRLKLRLIGLMTAAEPADEAGKRRLMDEIRELRRRIEQENG